MENTTLAIPTDRCSLRPATSYDYDALLVGIGAPEFPQELPLAGLLRQGRLKSWLESVLAMSASGRAYIFSIDLQTGERCIGQISLVQKDQSESWNLAFWLHPSYWGAGLAFETAAAVIRYAFTVLAIKDVWAGAALWNQRSLNTLIKLGLQPIAENDATHTPDTVCAFSISRAHWLQTYS